MTAWPITFDEVLAAEARIRPHLPPTALRAHPALDRAVDHGIRVWVKHENHQPTGSFKVRNGLSALSALSDAERARGVVAATRGNHGLGLAWAGSRLGVPVVICVPRGNSPGKNQAMRDLGAEVIESGEDYDAAAQLADRLVQARGATLVHSSNNHHVLAGAATVSLEILQERSEVDAIVVAVGGGSQAVGALTVARHLQPQTAVYAVQAAGASAIHDSWHAGEPRPTETAHTFADGLATRNVYEGTFDTLRAGLAGFVTVSEQELAEAVRLYLGGTHNLVEGAGAASLAGLRKLAPQLAGKSVAIILSGGNIDEDTLLDVLRR